MESIDELKQKTIDKSHVVNGLKKGFNSKGLVAKREASTKKYEKFLSETCYQNDNNG